MADQIFTAKCGFFDAVNSDRTYTADDMNKPYSRIIANGVFATNQGTASSDLQVVSAGTGMQITVQPGQGIFASKWFENQSSIVITVPNNTTLYPRIDSVLVQVDKRTSGRVGNIVYRTGTAASNPSAPEINTVANVIEYRVANIYVAASASVINNDAITDLRGSDSCPWVTSLIQQVDTSTLWNQFYSAYQKQYEQFTEDYNEYVDLQREAWEAFIEQLTSELTVTTNVVLLDSIYSATGTVSEIPINIPSFNYDTDILQVYINGLFSPEGTKWNILPSKDTIRLRNSIPAGNTVYFVVLKSLVNADVESAVSMIQRLNDILYSFMQDSGWINLMVESGATAYNSNTIPAVRKIGNRIYLRGAIKGLTNTGLPICTIPIPFRPALDHVFTSSAATSGGTVNNIVTITVSSTDGTVKLSAKTGTISATDQISIATDFLSATGYTTSIIYNYRGSVSTYANLPESGMVAGDVYMIETADQAHNIAAGDDVMWDGEEWELLNSVISSYEIDEIINSI